MVRVSLRAFLIAVLVPFSVSAAEITCKVVGVHDGDTLTCLTAEKRQVKVRLAEIDAPEMNVRGKPAQPYGQAAEQELSSMVFKKDVRIDVRDTDRYGRTVGRVYVGDIDVNAEMVSRGAAWAYRDYLKGKRLAERRAILYGLEADASNEKAPRGLWALQEDQRVAPWEYRHPTKVVKPVPRPVVSCEVRQSCGALKTCAEARAYLTQCKQTWLDLDRDGTPCDALCGQ